MIRRFGEPPERGVAYRLRPGAYAVLLRDREMLLTHQKSPLPEFQLPGGGIDPGESPVQALHREVYEETGYRLTTSRWVGTYRRFVYMPEYGFHAEKICHIFHARPARRVGPPLEPGHTVHWVEAEAVARQLSISGDRYFAMACVRH